MCGQRTVNIYVHINMYSNASDRIAETYMQFAAIVKIYTTFSMCWV